jgi:hypothetical protein
MTATVVAGVLMVALCAAGPAIVGAIGGALGGWLGVIVACGVAALAGLIRHRRRRRGLDHRAACAATHAARPRRF